MPKSEGRPAKEHERPAFGSVWTWGGAPIRFIAIGLRDQDNRAMLLAIKVPGGEITEPTKAPMTWGSISGAGLDVLSGWRCVDEGPAKRSHPHMEYRGRYGAARVYIDGKDVTDDLKISSIKIT